MPNSGYDIVQNLRESEINVFSSENYFVKNFIASIILFSVSVSTILISNRL
jgi:hypothetical protein